MKLSISFIWTISIYFLIGLNSYSQTSHSRFETFTINGEKYDKLVTCIFQDSKGFIWIGGYSGLLKYDGYDVTRYLYDPDDTLSIGDNKVVRIIEAKDGNLWISCQVGLYKFIQEKEIFVRYMLDVEGQLLRFVLPLIEDIEGHIWFGSETGTFRLDPQTQRNKRFDIPLNDPYTNGIDRLTGAAIDNKGRLWFTTANALNLYNSDSETFTRFYYQEEENQPSLDFMGFIHPLGNDHLLIPSSAGFLKFNILTQIMEPAFDNKYITSNHDQYLSFLFNQRDLWFTTVFVKNTKNIFIYDISRNSLTEIVPDPKNQQSFLNSKPTYLLKDNSDILWFGTLNGISLFNPRKNVIIHHNTKPKERIVSISGIQQPYEYSQGKIFLWEDSKLKLLDLRSGKLSEFPYKPIENNGNWKNIPCTFFRDSENILWIGTDGSGVFAFNENSQKFKHFTHNPDNPKSLRSNTIRDIIEDKNGHIWFAHWNYGVSKYDKKKSEFVPYISIEDSQNPNISYNSRTLFLDSDSTLWIGTREGLNKYNYEEDNFTRFIHDPDNKNSLSENTVFCMYEDPQRQLWIGTYGGGLNVMNMDTYDFRHYTKNDGLPDNTVFSIYPDSKKNLWLSTYEGLVRFNPDTKEMKVFDQSDGFGNKSFEAFGHFKSPYTGHLIFEGFQGIDIFHPDSIWPDTHIPNIVITGLEILNQPVSIWKDPNRSPPKNTFYLEKHITETTELHIPYRFNVITFTFAALNFSAPEKNQYAYYLEGFQDDWQYVGTNRTATYTNLDPGEYTLRVKGSNADGLWNEKGTSLILYVIPPWYMTGWAYAGYILLIAGIILLIYRFQLRRKLAIQETKKLKELDQIKSTLYTNISHEFRTPLTVISGMADEIQRISRNRAQEAATMIQRNSEQLLNLVNQLLSLRKLEANRLEIHFVQSDIISYLKSLVATFETLTSQYDIRLTTVFPDQPLVMDFDREKFAQIVNNLLSNAIKFTPEGGEITVSASQSENEIHRQFHLTISDTGQGIPESEIEKIFHRFYQADPSSTRKYEGTGIGLTLAKELVHLLHGNIQVQSEVGRGSVFTVTLPITKNAEVTTDSTSYISSATSVSKKEFASPLARLNKDLPVTLIIEDNRDVQQYIASCIQKDYHVEMALNGEEGIEKAIQMVPDIIVSDVMMPVNDGFEVCAALKEHFATSHIPIILLTARADRDSKIEGLELGADDYLPKPFDKEELLVRMNNLLKIRRKLQHYYKNFGAAESPAPPVNQREYQFVIRLKEIIDDHMSDENFGIAELCREIGMSRTQLHNKIKALTGKSTSLFIRSIRLTKAREMLLNTDQNVSEVAYSVGFKDPSYFTRLFTAEYGCPPTQVKQSSV